MTVERKAKVKGIDGTWTDINFADIKKGQLIRLFESDGLPVEPDKIMRVVSDLFPVRNEDGTETLSFQYYEEK